MYNQERQYEQELMKLPDPLTREEEKTATRDMLVVHNMRFAYLWGSRFANNNKLPRYDCIQEAAIGLCEAAKRFKPEKGHKFISYAVWWIKQRLSASLPMMFGIVRIPQNKRAEGERHLYYSLDDTQENESTGEYRPPMHNRLADPAPSPLENLVSSDEHEQLERLLGCLDEREQDIMRMYYGLDGGQPLTYQEIGDVYGLSRERIRQLVKASLGSLKKRSNILVWDEKARRVQR
jgi:RNA polymerase primary sigma factor